TYKTLSSFNSTDSGYNLNPSSNTLKVRGAMMSHGGNRKRTLVTRNPSSRFMLSRSTLSTSCVVRTCSLLAALLLACLTCPSARADVGVILNESLDTSVARITGSGHSAVYFSRICPASPVKLRLCLPGEQGSVMSNYTTLGEDQPFEWNVVPLSVYLYGVENPRYRPIVG